METSKTNNDTQNLKQLSTLQQIHGEKPRRNSEAVGTRKLNVTNYRKAKYGRKGREITGEGIVEIDGEYFKNYGDTGEHRSDDAWDWDQLESYTPI